MFKKILIANRGEIALRVIRACNELGIKTVAIYSTADEFSLHVKFADEAICIGAPPSNDSYLNIPRIIAAGEITNADAIHPGYGFLSESAKFSKICEDNNFCFLGSSEDIISDMGNKSNAKKTMVEAGVPVVPGSEGQISDNNDAKKIASKIGYPVIIKAAGGGGGRGMKVVHEEKELIGQIAFTKEEARVAFGNDAVYLEKYLEKPRHVEVQVLGDSFGNFIHLGDRDCSMQRRHQKIIEEALAPKIPIEEKNKLGSLCVKACELIDYRGAGTFEFLYEDGNFYFIEMNTRVQVEHPITEEVTFTDIVKSQLEIASGEKLQLNQQEVTFRGHAIECRINAEHPYTFIPSPGKVLNWHPPGGNGIRVDSHLYNGYKIPSFYDSLICKIIATGRNRGESIMRMKRALGELVIEGVQTNIPLHLDLLNDKNFNDANFSIHYLEKLIKKIKH
jgi:acetyl-CoA carboxylase biotin carboxylase subunit